jgi:hypothetical protein
MLRIFDVGFLCAVLGLGSGVCGVGSQTPLRWKAPALSAFMLVLWIGALGGGFGGVTYLALKAISLTEKLADLGQLVQWRFLANYRRATVESGLVFMRR